MSEATAHNPEDYKVGKGNILGGVENILMVRQLRKIIV